MTALPEIESRFDVLAKLGEGGMGCVYKVRHRDLDEIQIVKTLQAHLSSNESQRERFVNEARRGMRLRHPHIAGVHDFHVCADGTGYIVMEFVPGINLRDLLAVRGPQPPELVGAIAVQTLDALAYLHAQKFVHRDISPDNLILTTTADGRPFVKLIDLGISKSLESGSTMTATGQFLGKVHYASPEQFGGELDGRSDLYSLGVVLYKLLTNEFPFDGQNYGEIIRAHLFQPPRPFPANVPEPIQRVILRALEKEPEKRYANASEFADAVAEAFDVQDARPTRAALTRPDVDTTVWSAAAMPPLSESGGMAAALHSWKIAIPAIALVLAAALAIIWQRMEAAKIAAFGNFYAVVVGESHYQKFESLPTAVNDARAVAQLLANRYGFNVTRLEDANRAQILDALRATAKRMSPTDNLLIFYAGHGELLNGKGYWQPVDADVERTNWISPADIKDFLLDQPARRALIVADSCYSGAIAEGSVAPRANEKEREAKRSRLVISSGGTAPVIDSADGQHSMFTHALLDVFGEPSHTVADVQSAFAAIREHVTDAARRAGREQNPQLAVIAEVGDEGGSFFLVAKKKR
jgi:tRNA A-37 threonylcarbamoyl transferase component Bud32